MLRNGIFRQRGVSGARNQISKMIRNKFYFHHEKVARRGTFYYAARNTMVTKLIF